MKREYYPLEEAAEKILNCSIEHLIYLGSHEEIGIGAIIGNRVILKQVVDKKSGAIIEEQPVGFPVHKIKLHHYCIKDLEANFQGAQAILTICNGKPEDNIEVITILDRDTGKPQLLKDCKLIVYAEDLERFKRSQLSAKKEPADLIPDDKEYRTGQRQTKTDDEKIKLEKQLDAILEVIELKEFDPMAIPDGGKGTIQKICEADHPLIFDTPSSFDNAWKNGRKHELFRMANHASFARRGHK